MQPWRQTRRNKFLFSLNLKVAMKAFLFEIKLQLNFLIRINSVFDFLNVKIFILAEITYSVVENKNILVSHLILPSILPINIYKIFCINGYSFAFVLILFICRTTRERLYKL